MELKVGRGQIGAGCENHDKEFDFVVFQRWVLSKII